MMLEENQAAVPGDLVRPNNLMDMSVFCDDPEHLTWHVTPDVVFLVIATNHTIAWVLSEGICGWAYRGDLEPLVRCRT